jgi:hypothetical protein
LSSTIVSFLLQPCSDGGTSPAQVGADRLLADTERRCDLTDVEVLDEGKRQDLSLTPREFPNRTP